LILQSLHRMNHPVMPLGFYKFARGNNHMGVLTKPMFEAAGRHVTRMKNGTVDTVWNGLRPRRVGAQRNSEIGELRRNREDARGSPKCPPHAEPPQTIVRVRMSFAAS
jgi:hypothetical protein